MLRNVIGTAFVCAVASLVLVGCGKPQPNEPEPEYEEEPPRRPPPPEPPPPPLKCESFDEGCVAKADVWVSIGERAEFQPPLGWAYAKLDDLTIARHERDAAIGYRVLPEPLQPKKDAAAVISTLKPLFVEMAVEMPDATIKNALRKNGIVDDKGSLSLTTWDLQDKVKVDGEKGVVVLVVSTLASGQGLIGAVALKGAVVSDHLEPLQQSYRSVRGGQ